MIDSHHLVYAGTLAVFFAGALVVAAAALAVLTAVIVIVGIVHARRKLSAGGACPSRP